jgi:Zn-dependent peptidase ImmA (M78 family)
MVKQGFNIGNRGWWVMIYYDVQPSDLTEIEGVLLANGCTRDQAEKASDNLINPNTGFIITDYYSKSSTIIISKATSPEQLFDSIMHEVKHLVEHISNYYGLDPKEELSAYLQGEVGRLIFPAASLIACPKCNGD